MEKAGLAARVPARGQTELDRIKAKLDTLAVKRVPAGVASWRVDLSRTPSRSRSTAIVAPPPRPS